MGKRDNLVGQKFNRLAVIEFAHISNTHSYWKCICDCGKEKIVLGDNLKKKHTKSCGCLKNETDFKRIHRLKGLVFNRLTVVERSGLVFNKSLWKCQCTCGKVVFSTFNALETGRTKSCGCLKLDKTKSRKGVNHPAWRYDLSEEHRQESKDRSYNPKYKGWSKSVLVRDNFTCQISGEKGGNLSAHHILNWADNPNQRLDINNGITLLETVHKLFHKLYGNRNNTLEQINEFKLKWKNKQII
jgi:hypothetical protein